MKTLAAAAERLAAAGVEAPRAEADLLLAHVLGAGRDKLYIEQNRRLTPAEIASYEVLLTRRAAREPYAYLTGRREFLGRDFEVSAAVLIPRPETEELVLAALADRGAGGRRWLDLGTGSGAVAISLKLARPEAAVTGTDISAAALRTAARNGARLGADLRWARGDLFAAVADEVFDLIVMNPPYISPREYAACAPELRKEPSIALVAAEDGLLFYRRLAREAAARLSSGGALWMEIGAAQGAAVREIFTAAGWRLEIRRDLAGRERLARAVPVRSYFTS
ncbi:MAG: peptide chain release factor N(5)-glutamine methyltransferase [Gracilibacteraceae bacterium]|jgi:release factor glutamine methyltransferase|nr:peptide chain release factor N(5)-glutamine methyltransferase [Gracilibacteraceae bacterium]